MHLVIGGGTFYSKTASGTTLTAVTTPTGVTIRNARPCFARYRRKTVVNGRFKNGVCWHDDLGTLTKLGITAPTGAPVIAAGVSTGITNTGIRAYYTFVHESSSVLIQESNPSPISNTLTLTNQNIAYSSIDAVGEARVTHVYLYRSDGGDAVFRFDKKITIGTTSTTSTIPTLSLSQTIVLPQLSSGNVDVYARGVPPYCVFNKVYHDRMWYAGDPTYPYRVWYSRLGEPESVDIRAGLIAGQKGDYFDTRDGEAITGLCNIADQLVVFTAKSTYVIQGFTDGADGLGEPDFTMVKVAPSIGCISHFTIVNVGGPSGGDMIFFAAQDGVWAYNGSSFKYMMNDIRSDWRDAYTADKDTYDDDSVATFDHYFNVYKLLIPETSTSFYYIAHVLPMTQGGADQPDWTFDTRARRDSFVGNLANSSNLFESYTGSCDGFMRKENAMSVGDDDGVDKAFDVVHKHYYLGGISGGVNHGNKFTDGDEYIRNSNTAVTVEYYAGDELVADSATPSKSITIAASASGGYVEKGAQNVKLDKTTGRGITKRVTSTNPIGVEIAGFGLTWMPGQNTRKSSS